MPHNTNIVSTLVYVSNKMMRKVSSHKDTSSIVLANEDGYLDNKNRMNKKLKIKNKLNHTIKDE